MANPTPDFVQVQLSAAGVKLANGGPLVFANGRRGFSFVAGVAQKTEKSYEWNKLLSQQTDVNGDPLFEIVPSPASATATAGASPAASAAPVSEAATGTTKAATPAPAAAEAAATKS